MFIVLHCLLEMIYLCIIFFY